MAGKSVYTFLQLLLDRHIKTREPSNGPPRRPLPVRRAGISGAAERLAKQSKYQLVTRLLTIYPPSPPPHPWWFSLPLNLQQ